MIKFCLPESITAETFLRDYWQKKPLLIKSGLPQIVGQFEPQDIIELAQNEDVTARLIKQYADDNWKLQPHHSQNRIFQSYLHNGRCWCKIWNNGRRS